MVVGMIVIAVIRILCEDNSSLGTAVVNGLLAWATVLGGFHGACSTAGGRRRVLSPAGRGALSRRIDRWLGIGFLVGMPLGLLMFIVFVARIVS